ncbi:hypothetical protein [Microbacterium bovistercoris]|uniref:hypothetical protein n=1 Tax=Microbacterium bovistercoris TaxID=2293570 RepID=UPI000E238FF8|nr:hypothetical protein [Microbacterium bovistercoris]
MRAGAEYLLAVPYSAASLEGFSLTSSISKGEVVEAFDDVHSLGTAILDHERMALHAVQDRIMRSTGTPLEKLRVGFAATGALLADDVVVRAAFRLAMESREAFPERRLDPFRTWRGFVGERLAEAEHAGLLRTGLDLLGVGELLVTAGMGIRDLIFMHGLWDEAEERLHNAVTCVISLIRA